MSEKQRKFLSRLRGWATSVHAGNVATAIANGALTGHQPWYIVLAHLVVAAATPSPVAAAPKL